jgi:transposase
MSKQSVPNRQYAEEFKVEALRLAESVGINQAAKRLGMPSSSLSNWARLKRSGKLADLPRAGPLKGSPAELEAENSRLRRELANAKADLEIVKKAAAYFAKESR